MILTNLPLKKYPFLQRKIKKMKKEIKKELKQKLISFATIYLSGLKKTRQQKLNEYLEAEMNSVADYYVSLLTKKQLKKHITTTPLRENAGSEVLPTTENSNQFQGLQ